MAKIEFIVNLNVHKDACQPLIILLKTYRILSPHLLYLSPEHKPINTIVLALKIPLSHFSMDQ